METFASSKLPSISPFRPSFVQCDSHGLIYIRTLYCSINVSTCRTLRFVRCIFRLLVLFVKQTKSRTKTNFGATTTATPMMANSGRMPAVMWRKYTRKTSSVRPVMFSLFSLCSLFSKKYRINKTHSMWQKFGFCFGLYDLSDEAVGLSSCINWKCFIFIQVRMSLLLIEISFFRMKAWILASGTLPIGNGILYTRGLCEEDAVYIPTPQGHQLVH